MDTVCIFCGAEATWDEGELVCLECAAMAQIAATIEEYEEKVRQYGCPKAKAALRMRAKARQSEEE